MTANLFLRHFKHSGNMLTVLSRRALKYFSSAKHVIKTSSAINYSTNSSDDNINNKSESKLNDVLGSIAAKYQVFRNEDSSIILDVNEQNLNHGVSEPVDDDIYDIFAGLNLARGVNGVYEIEDLVEVLQRENAQNIFVAKVPNDLKYVDYICVVTGRNFRHMLAIAQFVRKLFKVKKKFKDIVPKIEGENSKEWIAMDLGNIALHIFSDEARQKYDLDLLWSVGEEYDDECNKPDDPIVQLLQQHSVYLKDLHPADNNT